MWQRRILKICQDIAYVSPLLDVDCMHPAFTSAARPLRSKCLNIDSKVFSGLMSRMKTNAAIRADLKKLGCGDEQLPSWVAAGAVTS